MKVKVDKTVLASVALHVLVLGWVMLSFSTRALEVKPEESVGVDISLESQVAAGIKTGKKEEKKPLVEKVAEAKPIEDAVGKIEEKKPPVVTETAPAPQPKPEEKPVEKKPDPPKQVTEKKEEPKPEEKKPEPAVDPIAEAIKKEQKKPTPPKPPVQAAKPPEQQKPKERVFDQSKIAALIDKRDPARQAATGETLNSNAQLGLSKGRAADNSATWGSMFRRQVENCWRNKPYAGIDQQTPVVVFSIKLKRDGSLETMPVVVETPPGAYARAYQESAMRAIIQCQPYNLPATYFDEWKAFEPVFQEKSM